MKGQNMSKYKPAYKTTHRRLNIRLIAGLIALVGTIGTVGLGFMGFRNTKKVAQAKEKIETIKMETTNIEQQIPQVQADIKNLNEEVTGLQNILWRYEPVVIPESMK